jgi:hypothetical protein
MIAEYDERGEIADAERDERIAERYPHWTDRLDELGACDDAIGWGYDYDTIDAAWAACRRADWMLWLHARVHPSEPFSPGRVVLVGACLTVFTMTRDFAVDAHGSKAVHPLADTCALWAARWVLAPSSRDRVRRLAKDAQHECLMARVNGDNPRGALLAGAMWLVRLIAAEGVGHTAACAAAVASESAMIDGLEEYADTCAMQADWLRERCLPTAPDIWPD